MSLTAEPGGAGKSGFVRGHFEELSGQRGETKEVERTFEFEGRSDSGPVPHRALCLHPANEALCSNQGARGVHLRVSGPGVATLVLLSPWALAWAAGCDIFTDPLLTLFMAAVFHTLPRSRP